MEILLTITYTALFIFIIHKMKFFRVEGISTAGLSLLFILKILAGLALWAIYTFYYTDRATADIYKYFDDSLVIYNALSTEPADYFRILFGIGNNSPHFDQYYNTMHFWARAADSGIYNDSHTIIRFNALARLFSFGYYNVHTVFICFLSLTGLTAIYKTFAPHLKDKRKELILVIFLLPSVIFWGSGVLKEGLIFFAIGLLIYHANKLFSIRSLFICIVTTMLLALSKFYVWLSILPALLFLIWLNHTQGKQAFVKFVLVISFIALAGLNIDKFSTIQNPLVTLSQKQLEFNRLADGEMLDSELKPIPIAGSVIHIPKLEPTFGSFVMNAPQALANVMFRPLPWEMRSPLLLLAGLENTLVLLIILLCLTFCKPFRYWPWKYVLFCSSFVVLQFLIIGETTPIIGAIARYRCISLPFLLIGFLSILDKEKIMKRIPLYGRVFK